MAENTIKTRLREIKQSIPAHVTLVAVSKTFPASAVIEAYEAGQRVFAENRHAELVEKAAALPRDVEWHFIGHLQTNKVKYIAPVVSMIQSADSGRLLEVVDKEAAKAARVIDVLLEVFIARDQTKSGWDRGELREYLRGARWKTLTNVRIRGVMGMATYTDDTAQVAAEFAGLRALFEELKREFFADDSTFDTVSMGMSGDYALAIANGSTMVRIGSSIFGAR